MQWPVIAGHCSPERARVRNLFGTSIHDIGNLSQAAPAGYAGDMSRVPEILNAIDNGDALAVQQLLPLVYDELRTLAAAKLAQERPGQTLDATALVHEAGSTASQKLCAAGTGNLRVSAQAEFSIVLPIERPRQVSCAGAHRLFQPVPPTECRAFLRPTRMRLREIGKRAKPS
jgi:hypothetical protein